MTGISWPRPEPYDFPRADDIGPRGVVGWDFHAIGGAVPLVDIGQECLAVGFE
jgi:hypothetical protein